ncbi:MAG: tetratricopeptide repeat protein [Syntrophothermus sp.]
MQRLIYTSFFLISGFLLFVGLINFNNDLKNHTVKNSSLSNQLYANEIRNKTLFPTKPLTIQEEKKVAAYNQSINFEQKKDLDNAIKQMLSIYDKEDYLINLRLGWLQYNNHKYEESVNYYSNSLRISDNKSIEAYLGLTLPLASLNNWDKVKDAYIKILKIDGFNYTANLRLGQIYLNSLNYNNARKHLEIVKENYPSDYEANLSLGWTYYYLGDNTLAKQCLTNALLLSPNDSLALSGLNLIK